ncbi:MAG: hypothetical protein AAGC77_08290 [Pseudomonadota bacterium]
MAKRLGAALSAAAILMAAGALPAAAQVKSRLIANDDPTGLEAYAVNRPCGRTIDIELRAPSPALYSAQSRETVRTVIGTVIFILAIECENQNFTVNRFTFAGRANNSLFFAAAAYKPPQSRGWSQYEIEEISSLTE